MFDPVQHDQSGILLIETDMLVCQEIAIGGQ